MYTIFAKPCRFQVFRRLTCHSRSSTSSAKCQHPSPLYAESHPQLIQAAKNILNVDLSPSSSNHPALKYDLIKKQKALQPLQSAIEKYDQLYSLACELKKMAETDSDQDMREIATSELRSIENSTIPGSIESLKESLLLVAAPRPASYQQSALVEIKPGVGGVEASHFATTLMNIYTKLATRKRWSLKPISVEYMTSGQGQDGLREAVLEIAGDGAYGSLRWEAGVHRVLPLNPSCAEEDPAEGLFDEKDIKLETMRSQGAGGQHVNKTESAVRLTHIPTGTVVSMQDSRSQHQNRERAYMILRARLLDLKAKQKQIENRDLRLSQVKNSNRSEKIRTYNFQQGRVTDHRIGLTLPRLNDIVEGGETMDIIWDGLSEAEETELIQNICNHNLPSSK